MASTPSIPEQPSLDGIEARWSDAWEVDGTYRFRRDAARADVFAIETREWGRARVRAVRDDGEVLWQQESPGIPLFGDTFGGLVTGVLADVNAGSDYGALEIGRAHV